MALKDNWETGDIVTAADLNAVATDINTSKATVDTFTATGLAVATAADDTAARTAINAGSQVYVDARDYGAVGDGSTDDTAALQAWITYLVANHRQGWLPNGTYKITSTLVAPGGYDWGITGESGSYAKIVQYTDNTPILQIGDTDSSSHSLRLEYLYLSYNAAQAVPNTDANCIVFMPPPSGDKSSVYWSKFRGLTFWNGYYAMRTYTGAIQPWGCEFDDFVCRYMSGGFWNGTGSANSGTPNNRWGRHTFYCDNAVGPMFKSWMTSLTTVDCFEFLTGANLQLITTQSGTHVEIGTIQWEAGEWTAAGLNKPLVEFSNPVWARIDRFSVAAYDWTPTSSIQYLIGNSEATSGISYVDIGLLAFTASGTVSGTNFAVSVGGTAQCNVKTVSLQSGMNLVYAGGSYAPDGLTVRDWVNHHASTALGDADHTVAVGDENIKMFKTAFTASRNIVLPAKGGSNLCNGLYYDLIFDGAINGSNYAVIKEGANTLRTQKTDKVRLRYMWRRQNTTGEWFLHSAVDLSDPATTYTPTNVSTDRSFDADSTTTEELADVLGTLIADLKAKGIIAS